MQCPKCGINIERDTNVCPNCGMQVERDSNTHPDGSMQTRRDSITHPDSGMQIGKGLSGCHDHGMNIERNANICPSRGYHYDNHGVTVDSQNASARASHPLLSKRTLAEIVVASLLLAALAFSLFFLPRVSSQKGKDAENTAESLSRSSFDDLRVEYENLELSFYEQVAKWEDAKKQYGDHLVRMKGFNELSDTELDFLRTKIAEAKAYAAAKADAYTKEEAVARAQEYLNALPHSYNDLLYQLTYIGYSEEEAVFALEHCGADWNEQAVRQLKACKKDGIHSKDRLLKMLLEDGFTEEQAKYAVDTAG